MGPPPIHFCLASVTSLRLGFAFVAAFLGCVATATCWSRGIRSRFGSAVEGGDAAGDLLADGQARGGGG